MLSLLGHHTNRRSLVNWLGSCNRNLGPPLHLRSSYPRNSVMLSTPATMKFFLAILAAASVGLLAPSQLRSRAGALTQSESAHSAVPVLVELFTSEGCSSCPPADAFLARLDSAKMLDGVEVIALEEHVDYWDHLGWRDPFSSSQWTSRQQDYATVLHSGGIYTPQMVVDGTNQLIGSREGQARQAIVESSLQQKTAMELQIETPASSTVHLKILVHAFPANIVLKKAKVYVAVTERGLHTNVRGGENSGQDLHHSEVLRTLHVAGNALNGKDPSYTGEQNVELSSGWNRANLRFVVFLQDPKTLRVVGAATVGLP